MADISHIKGPDNTSYDIKDATARSDISNLATVASTGEYSDLLHPPTVAEIDDSSTTADKAWSASKINTELGGKADSSHTHTISQVTWPQAQNLSCTATTDNQEYSIDLPSTNTGCYFHVWSGKNGNTILRCDNDKSTVEVPNGNLYVTGSINAQATGSPNMISKATGVDASKANNNVSSDVYPAWNAQDSAGRILTRMEGVISPSGPISSYWYVRNYNTSGTIMGQKGIKISMAKDGSLTYTVDDNSKFRTALGLATVASSGSYNDLSNKPTIPDVSGKVNRSGDTMTGNLGTTDYSFVSKSASMPASPSSGNLYLNGFYMQDAANDNYAYLRAHSASAEKGLQLEVRRSVNGSYVYNTLNMRINASGGRVINVSDGGAWRSAIGAQAALSTYDVSYTRSHASVGMEFKCWRYGNVVTIGGYFSCQATIAANTVLYSNFPKPKYIMYFTCKHEGNATMYAFNMNTSGQFKTNQQIIGGNYLITMTYVCT